MLETLNSSPDHSVKLGEIRQSAGKIEALCYLTGVYLGDGWIGEVQNRTRFRLNTIDRDFAKATVEAIEILTGRRYAISEHPVKKSKNNNYSVTALIDELGFIKDLCNHKTVIPEYVWKAHKKAKTAFVAGIMDSEGYCANGTKNRKSLGVKAVDKWIMDFYKFMDSLGVQVGKQGFELLPSGKTSVRYHFNITSFNDAGCYFNIRRKQQRIEDWLLNPQRLHVRHKCDDIVRTHVRA